MSGAERSTRRAVLTAVTVEDIDFTAFARKSVLEDWDFEEGDVGRDRDCSDDV